MNAKDILEHPCCMMIDVDKNFGGDNRNQWYHERGMVMLLSRLWELLSTLLSSWHTSSDDIQKQCTLHHTRNQIEMITKIEITIFFRHCKNYYKSLVCYIISRALWARSKCNYFQLYNGHLWYGTRLYLSEKLVVIHLMTDAKLLVLVNPTPQN